MDAEMLKWIQFAIDTEQKGIDFYTKCHEKILQARARELFEFLIEVENKHKAILTRVLESETKGDKMAMEQSLSEYLASPNKNPMFPKETLEKMRDPTTAIHDMFNTAMQMEDDGIKLYTRLASETDNPKLKLLFESLVKDEQAHKQEIRSLGFHVFGMPLPTEEEIKNTDGLNPED